MQTPKSNYLLEVCAVVEVLGCFELEDLDFVLELVDVPGFALLAVFVL